MTVNSATATSQTSKGRGYSFVATVVLDNTGTGNDKFQQQGRLPVRPLMMVGRRNGDPGEVSDKLRDERFVTLLGPGEIGKMVTLP